MLCASSWCFPVQSCDKCCQLANCRVSVSEGPGTPKRPSVERAACLGGTHASHHTRIHERNPKFPPSRSLRAETNYGSTRRQRQGNDRVLNLQDPKLPPKVWQESVVLNLVFSSQAAQRAYATHLTSRQVFIFSNALSTERSAENV